MNASVASIGDQALRRLRERVSAAGVVDRRGRVSGIAGTIIRARIPDMRFGELCGIDRPGNAPLPAEVIGFDDEGVILMPLGGVESVCQNAVVVPLADCATVPVGAQVCGRVLNALGEPIDGLGSLERAERRPMIAAPPDPLRRRPIGRPLETGVRAVDAMLTVGEGQRLGVFAAAGAGKSTLLAMLCRNVDADVRVLALIGERGWEVNQFIEHDLGEEGMRKSTVVVSTSDQPALLRLKAAYTATAIAEAARREGKRVVLMMDSVTRFARAAREVGLAAGEPVGRQGYPSSVFSALPQLFERAGNDDRGSITAFYTVLVAGDDIEEPVADETISLLDGHIILSRKLAERGHYPAIDVRASVSRWMSKLVDSDHRSAHKSVKEMVSLYEDNYDKFVCGVYEDGNDPAVDRARNCQPDIMRFLRQGEHERTAAVESRAELLQLERMGI